MSRAVTNVVHFCLAVTISTKEGTKCWGADGEMEYMTKSPSSVGGN